MAMMQMAGGMEGEQARSTSRKDGPPVANRILRRGDLTFELNEELTAIRRLCIEFYQPPPSKALYLQLYHSLGDAGMCINGRKYLGNTPTMIAGPTTKMRFGVVAMGSDFHTFHIHGHRWIIPGPHGNTLNAIQTSPQDTPVSQFEDTRIMGPANSLAFTIQESAALPSFMRAEPAIGEWHMHCHVLQHMMDGMMGSLLVIHPNGGLAFALPQGKPCPAMGGMGGMGGTGNGGSHADVTVDNFQFTPHDVTVPDGGQVTFHFQQANHTVMTVSNTNADPIAINNGGGPADPVPPGSNRPVTIHGMSGGRIDYQCGIHGASMSGTIHIA